PLDAKGTPPYGGAGLLVIDRHRAQAHAARRSDPHPSSAVKRLARMIRGRMLASAAEEKLLIQERKVSKSMPPLPLAHSGAAPGSRDGDAAGDHDQPYRFGIRPRANAPYPFNTRQYARLLVLRGRTRDQLPDRQASDRLGTHQ